MNAPADDAAQNRADHGSLPHVALQDLRVLYGSTVAVDGVSFAFAPGRIHGLLGRNGSGKTSLLSVIAGYRRPSAGQVLVDGQPAFDEPHAMGRTCFIRGAGDTVEHNWPMDRVKDALRVAGSLRPHWDQGFADELASRFRLNPRKRLSQLSTGQRSAVGVVLGLASRAPLTIFDESYLGMDATSRYAFYDSLLEDHLTHPRTLIISTHLIEEVASLFEHVTIIDEGRLLLQDEADAVREQGATVTGPRDLVDPLLDGVTVLATRTLGPTVSVTTFGAEVDQLRTRAASTPDVEVSPAALQDLFVHLTSSEEERA